MLPALVSLQLALVLMLIAPRLLGAGTWQVRRPRLALRLWSGTLVTGVVALAAIPVLLVRASRDLTPFADMPGVAIHRSVVVPALAWVGLALAGALAGLVAGTAEDRREGGRRALAPLRRLADAAVPLAAVAPRAAEHVARLPDGADVMVVDGAHPSAVALPGGPGRVVISRGLVALLEPDELAAVVAHERAHLRGRHHLLAGTAELHAACLPGAPGGLAHRRATRLLVELIADDAAVAACGSAVVARALRALADRDPTVRSALHLRADRLDPDRSGVFAADSRRRR